MTRFIARFGAALALMLGTSLGAAAAGTTPITAVPPAEFRPGVSEKSTPVALLLPADAPAARITLAEPSLAERGALKTANAAGARAGAKAFAQADKGAPLAVGFGRSVPAAARTVALDALAWQRLPDGSRAAHIVVQSPGAAAMRVAIQLPAVDPDIAVRFAGTGPTVYGPVPANAMAADTLQYGQYWSPVVEGDVVMLELHAPTSASLAGVSLTLPAVSHQVVPPANLRALTQKDISDIGRSGACEIDVGCVTPQSQAFVNGAKAVAKIIFTQENGSTYLCTGQLLNDSTQSFTPYFFSANHCINSATAARTINTYWFFDAVSCANPPDLRAPLFVQQTAGAALLARSPDYDWAIMRLNALPPAGTFYSAWRADPIPTGSAISVIHHPQGDLKKWAGGTMPGLNTYTDGTTFFTARYSQGTTEGGSSGAGLLTFNGAGGYYEVRGGLFGGEASCASPAGLDVYSQLGTMLPKTREYLTPDSNPAGTVAAVEFYNRGLNHFFLSTDAAEIADLDAGRHPGWERTGIRFNAYASQVAGSSPVCRFYRAPAYGDSHFYSASPTECAQTALAHPIDWIYESPAVFYIFLPNPTTGACPIGTQSVWRFFNQVTTNHRYTPEVALHDSMRADPATWVAEGYGADAVIMCAPLGS